MTETVNLHQSYIETTKRYSSLFEIHIFVTLSLLEKLFYNTILKALND